MAVTVEQGAKQFQGAFTELWLVTDTALNFGAAATGSGTFASVDVAVPNVAIGDMVMGIAVGVDTVDAVIGGAVTAAGVVTLTLLNNTAGAVDLASTTGKFVVGRPSW
tara:strand:- start:259 stop:582 length:324 start_codon:yes stop_codon:yes gene_type:complete